MNKLFKFPIVMIDGDNEDRKEEMKEKLALSDDQVDIIIGYAECPHYDFLCIADRWMPTDDSFQRALEGKFDACHVTFNQSGAFIVPWPRDKFKKKLQDFKDSLPEKEVTTTILSKEELKEILGGKD